LNQERWDKYQTSVKAHVEVTEYPDLTISSGQFLLDELFELSGVKWLRKACNGEIVTVTIYATLFDRESLAVIATQAKSGEYKLKVTASPYINAD